MNKVLSMVPPEFQDAIELMECVKTVMATGMSLNPIKMPEFPSSAEVGIVVKVDEFEVDHNLNQITFVAEMVCVGTDNGIVHPSHEHAHFRVIMVVNYGQIVCPDKDERLTQHVR